MNAATARQGLGDQSRAGRARELGLLAASTAIYQSARFFFSLAAAAVLSSDDFSLWALTLALLAYAPAVLLGTNNGMARELPIAIGANRHESADRAVATTWLVTGVALLILMASALAVAAIRPSIGGVAVAVGVLACGTIVFGVQQFVLRSRLRFGAAGVQQALLGLLLVGSAAYLMAGSAAPFFVAAALYGGPLAIAVVIGFAMERANPRGGVDSRQVRRLVSSGFPIMLSGLVFSAFVTLDRWIAVALLGADEAAPYQLASLLAAAMLVIPSVVSQHTYPRMAIARGSGAGDAALFRLARNQGLLAAGLVTPVAVALAVFSLVAIPALLPQYAAAVPSVILLSGGFVVLAFLTGYGNYLNVVGAQWRYLAAQLSGATAAVALMLVGGLALGLSGIAAGMAAGHVIYGMVLWQVASRTRAPIGLRRP